MTTKDYEVIARAVSISSGIAGSYGSSTIELVINHLCVALAMDNPAFEAHKFRAACSEEASS